MQSTIQFTQIFNENLIRLFELSDKVSSILFFVTLMVIFSFKYIISNRKEKLNKENEIIEKIIFGEINIENIINQPYIIKSIYFKQFFSFKNYSIKEIEYFLNGFDPTINFYQLSKLKNMGFLKFYHNRYALGDYGKFKKFLLNKKYYDFYLIIFFMLFFILILFIIIITQSIFVFIFLVTIMAVLELYLLNLSEAIEIYVNNKDDIETMINYQ